jgi:colicin import membrane protein
MSRTRKGGKYKGGGFASQFKQGLSMQSPMFAVAVVGDDSPEDIATDATDIAENALDNLDGKPPVLSELEDVVDEKQGSSARRTERQNWKARAKQEGERLKEEAAAKAKEEEEAAAAAAAEEEREALSQGKNIEGSYELEYDDDMSGKERRQESRENKKQIREAKKAAKGEAKDEFKNKKQAIKDSGVKGKEKRQAKKDARQEKKADKKSIRKNKKAAKKSNRKARKGK